MKNLFDVSGKVALVTGGSRGIGEMIATGFVEAGVKVYISARKAQVCNELAEELSKRGTCISLPRSEEHTSELQSLMRISYAVFCLKKKNITHEISFTCIIYEQ